jgi:hypothetical protein
VPRAVEPIAAIVPLYFTGSPASHVGVPLEKSPQSLTTRSSLADIGFEPSESLMFDRESVKAPESEPVFCTSTVPFAESPGLMLLAVRTARPSLELRIESVPAANVLLGFADVAVKLALDPTATATAVVSAASAPSSRSGWRATNVCMRCPFLTAVAVGLAVAAYGLDIDGCGFRKGRETV